MKKEIMKYKIGQLSPDGQKILRAVVIKNGITKLYWWRR
jgi:hypothetical protein